MSQPLVLLYRSQCYGVLPPRFRIDALHALKPCFSGGKRSIPRPPSSGGKLIDNLGLLVRAKSREQLLVDATTA
jgi:hypothetical protein